ncbi:MAG TPA: M15 family metallopeptidase [Gemmatimonadaceae bacterium]|nr:M15 family metallopeptidase [Gemmatimonadaceae bacterium]
MRKLLPTLVLAAACSHAPAAAIPQAAQVVWLLPGEMPDAPPRAWLGLIGEYDAPTGERLVLEDSGRLYLADTTRHSVALIPRAADEFAADAARVGQLLGPSADLISFGRDVSGRAQWLSVGGTRIARRDIEPGPGTNQLRITPLRPVEELRTEALAASPPVERGEFRTPDFVELTSLDSTIKLEVRYATTNNFLGTRFYSQARAFMQRPAAEAVVRANRLLKPLGYGLLIHDAYRPWYVTKMFWDATPPDKRWLVANPAQGSRHNRGEAVDLTLYELPNGRPVDMPSTYDESTDRAYADYPGGTALQRWHRALLRRAMESVGFTVNPTEWWHFDYKEWQAYPIGNVPFERLQTGRAR